MSSPYDILGVERTASEQDIKRAYRALTLKYHPDRNPTEEAASKIREINDAYGILSDPQKRRQLDMMPRGPAAGFAGFRGPGGIDVEIDPAMDIFQMLFGAGLGGGGPTMMFHHGGGSGGGLFPPEAAFFQHQGGGGMSSPFLQPQHHRPPPLQQHLTLTLEQAYTGCTVPIEVERWVMHGHMKIQEIETVYVDIPAGIDESEIITLADKGNVLHDQNKGAVKINVHVENTTIFRRQGLDLIYAKTLTLKESLCGFSFEMKHINGKTLAMNNTQNVTMIKPNFRKVVPGMGMTRDKNVGALIIEFDVKFPDSLTPEQINSIRDIL